MKKVVLLFTLLSVVAHAQTQSTPPGTISKSRSDDPSKASDSTTAAQTSAANQSAASAQTGANLTFTNAQGQSYTVAQLAEQLRTLRASVEQTMPMISAFNETYSNSPSGDKTLTGRISGLLSGALNRNEGTNNSSGQSSSKYGNLVSALENALSKNSGASAPISANTIRDLETLQTQLQPVSSTLQHLNVDIPGTSGSTSNALTPTGKTTSKTQSSQPNQNQSNQ